MCSQFSGAGGIGENGRLPDEWIVEIGLAPSAYGTHSLRRTKAALIYRKTGNIRAVQLLLGHTKLDSTVRYLGVEVEDALAIAESIDALGDGSGAMPWMNTPRVGARKAPATIAC
jgi:integrase